MKRQLGNDHNLWPQQIIEFLYSDYPFVSEYMKGIKFQTVDPKTGTAMGGILLENPSSGMTAVVPIIISEFSLNDLNVFVIDDEKYVPLTETRLIEYLGVFSGKLRPKKKGKGSMPVKTAPPGHDEKGRTKTASLFKCASSKLGIGPGMLKIIMDSMKNKDDGLVASRIKSIMKDLPYRAVWITYSSSTNKWVATASDDRFNLTVISGKEEIIKNFAKFDTNIEQEMQRSDNIFLTRGNRKPFISEDHLGAPIKVTSPGTVSVITSANEVLVGYGAPDCTDLLGRSIGSAFWFDGKNYFMGDEISGYFLRDSHAPRVSTVKAEQQYCFSFTKEGAHKCTAPFKVMSKPKVEGQGLTFRAITHFGKEVTIKYSKEVQEPISSLGDAVADMEGEVIYYIPTTYKLNKVGENKVSLTYLTEKSFANILTENLGDSVQIFGFNEDGAPYYYLKGRIAKQLVTSKDISYDKKFGKYAKNGDTLIWYLINMGFSEGTAQSIISSVWENDGSVTIGNIAKFKDIPVNLNMPEELVSLAEDKVIPEDSVESILGLGFINNLDVMDSLEYLDDIKQLESILAKLLFQIRLGAPLAQEETVSRALEYVSGSIDQLEETKHVLLKKTKK
jgi:hypothetical protein